MNKRKWILIAIALVVVVGGGVWFARGAGANPVAPYRVGEIRQGTVESTVTSTGRLNAIQSVAVGTQVSGRVTALYADYNDRVRAGQLIARIDPTLQEQAVRNSRANLERVRAALAQAERDYQRNLALYDRQVITEAEFNQIEYSLTVARSNAISAEVSLEQALQNLSYTEIYAPIDGVVIERNVELGQTVAASLSAPQLYLLASDLGEMEILAGVDESDIGDIQAGMPARFSVQAYPGSSFQGVVRQVRLSSSTQENVVNYTAVISVQNPDGRLLPGMTAVVDFIVQRAENVLMVPNSALRFRATDEMIAQLTDPEMIALVQGGPRMAGAAGMGTRVMVAPGAQGENGATPAAGQAPSASPAGEGAAAAEGAERPQMAAGGGGGARAGTGGGQAGRGGAGPGAAGGPGGGGGWAGAGGAGGGGGAAAMARAALAAGGEGAFMPGGGRPNLAGSVPTFANLWYVKDGKLGITQVRTGISDGTNTEIAGPGLEPGMEVIIGLTQPQSAASGNAVNPFQQQRGGGGGFGGGMGGGGGGGFIGRP